MANNIDLQEKLNIILNEIKEDIINNWEMGDNFRRNYQFIKEDDTLVGMYIKVDNHIADFDSKYDLQGNYFHTSNRWILARQFDLSINENLIDLAGKYNSERNDLSFEVILPGNILRITSPDSTI